MQEVKRDILNIFEFLIAEKFWENKDFHAYNILEGGKKQEKELRFLGHSISNSNFLKKSLNLFLRL